MQACMSPATLQKKQNCVPVECDVLRFSENDAVDIVC